MARQCTVCGHPEREAIDHALVDRRELRGIARTFGLSEDAVTRHKHNHLPQHLCQATAAQEVTQADGLLAKVQALEVDAKRIQGQAEAAGDLRTALQGIRELVRIVELQARLLGELKDGQTVNLLILPQWQDLRTVILQALLPYPDARAAVATALLPRSPDVHPNGTGAGAGVCAGVLVCRETSPFADVVSLCQRHTRGGTG